MNYKEIAAQLLAAERKRLPVEPLTLSYPDITVNDAYNIQRELVASKLAEGRKVIGKKVGLTAKSVQRLLGVNEPDFGYLLDDMLICEGEPCLGAELIQPKIEGELAFILREKLLGPGVTIADVFRATEGVMPAFEIVDSRVRDWKIKLPDTVADNASSARLVLGSRFVPITNLDLRLIGMVLEKNGQVASTGAGAAVWGHPAAAVAWLANKLGEFGIALEAGEIILSGAMSGMEVAEAGDVFTLSIGGLGTVNLKFI